MNTAQQSHMLFPTLPVEDICSWPGTSYEDGKLLPCGAETIGNGLFCDPSHKHCFVSSVCDRHKKPIEDWEE